MARKERKTKKTVKGGAYVASGSYGCTFKPPLPCMGKARQRNGISKLVGEDSFAGEVEAGDAFRDFDPEQKFFLSHNDICDLDDGAIEAANSYNECTARAGRTKLLFYEDGGVDLARIKLRPADYIPFLKSLVNLFKGLHLAHTNQRYHMDIKTDNVVSKKQIDGTFLTRFIDLGLASYPVNGQPLFREQYPHASYYRSPEIYYFNVPRGGIESWGGQSILKATETAKSSAANYLETVEETLPDSDIQRSFTASFLAFIENRTYDKQYTLLDYIYSLRENLKQKVLEGSDLYSFGFFLSSLIYRIFNHSAINYGDILIGQPYNTTINGMSEGPAKVWHTALRNQVTRPLFDISDRLTSFDVTGAFPRSPIRFEKNLLELAAEYSALFPEIERLCTAENITRFVTAQALIIPEAIAIPDSPPASPSYSAPNLEAYALSVSPGASPLPPPPPPDPLPARGGKKRVRRSTKKRRRST